MCPIRSLCVALALASPCAFATATTVEPPLDQLVGLWKVSATIEGKSVEQKVEVVRTLAGRFVELHFTSDAPPDEGMPNYEARVFLGWDQKKSRVVSFWMDVFGAAGASAGEGRVLGAHAFEVVFKYPTGWFRNTYTHDPAADSWRLLIESRNKAGKWSTFADEKLTR